MPHGPAGYLVNPAVCVRNADAKVMEIIFEGGAGFTSRGVTR
jgi:hypothetical protein